MESNETYKQNEVKISLLARMAFPEDVLKKIISKKKQNPAAYIRAYNACDGEKGVTDIAKIAGVSQPTMTYILQTWKKIGIVYQPGKNYVKLYYVMEDKEEEKNGKPTGIDAEDSQAIRPDNQADAEESRTPEQQ